MAKAQTRTRPGKKAASRFYVVRTIHDVRQSVAERVEHYRQEWIEDPIASGKEVVADFRDDPRKTLENLVDDGRKRVDDLKKDAVKKVNRVVADGKKHYKKARKNPRKTIGNMMDGGRDFAEDLFADGKAFMQGVEKDARIVMDEMVDSGKEALDNLPGKKKFQKEIAKRIKSVPLQFNLPTRTDIDLLKGRLADLDAKVDTLGKAYAA